MDLNQRLQLHPSLFTTVWLGIISTHTASPYPDIVAELPTPHQLPTQLQTSLGWEQILSTHWVIPWTTAIDTLHPNLASTGKQVLISMTLLLWTYVLETWKLWNQHLHHQAETIDLPNFWQAVITLYEQWHQLPPPAQAALYTQPLETVLEYTGPCLQKWVQKGYKFFNQQLNAEKKCSNEHPQHTIIPSCPSSVRPWSTTTLGSPVPLHQCGSSLYAIVKER